MRSPNGFMNRIEEASQREGDQLRKDGAVAGPGMNSNRVRPCRGPFRRRGFRGRIGERWKGVGTMGRGAVALGILLLLSTLAGCATPYVQGQTALRQGRYDEAAGHFEEVLARNPDRLDALAGLGLSRYKSAAFDEAVDALRKVVARDPKHTEARLYLGLSYLQKGEDGSAEEQLNAVLDLKPAPRLAAQIDRALRVIRLDPLSDRMRAFLAASLEDEVEWEREVREARLAQRANAQPARLLLLRPRHSWPYPYPLLQP